MANRDENGRFLPGESGNPNGRPRKENSMTDILAEKVDKETIADKLIELALAGDMAALKYVYDRIDGTPRQSIEHTGLDGGPMAITYVKDFDGI